MIKNYLRSAFRNIKRHRLISFINIFGLTVGLTCCLLILSYIINERSYDQFNVHVKDIRRVTRIFYAGKNVESLHLSAIAPPFGPLLQSAFPDIKKMTRVLPIRTTAFHYNDKLFNEQTSVFAEENFFDFFTVPVVKGDPDHALKEPYSMMLSEAMAHKYFGDADPIGKGLLLDNVYLGKIKHDFKVTGVFKAFPANSHMHPEILLSFSTLKDPAIFGQNGLDNDFGGNAFFTYLLFPKGYNTDRIESQLLISWINTCTLAVRPETLKHTKVPNLHLKNSPTSTCIPIWMMSLKKTATSKGCIYFRLSRCLFC